MQKSLMTGKKVLLGVGLLVFFVPANAHATKKVYGPNVEKGELEIEYRGGYDIDDDSDADGAWKQKFAVGYGFTDMWFSEIYAEFEREGESGANPEFTAIEWENRFKLTEQGEYWVDIGLLTELVYNTSGGADKAEVKLLLAKDVNKFSHLANFKLEREFGEDSSDDTEYGVSWSSRYRYKPEFEPGIEIHSDLGEFGGDANFDEQKHQIGPVIYGSLGHFAYDVGVLFGASDAAPDASLKAILEYEWYF